MTRILSALAAVMLLGFGLPAAAQDKSKGTAAEATAMVDKAIAHIKKVGREKAFADFSSKKAPWVDRDLYVVVYDMQGLALAHPNPKWRGKNMMDIRDQSGRSWVKERSELAQKQASGLQDTEIFNPVTKKVEPKKVYWERHGDLIFISGAYVK